ncbi:MAG TPA: family 16 glycoside hydrolase [Candidatus Acidoferrum sp.]|nr:family 16 glycoside hydrolase [Candidatus Acidoferrum sp.]
MRGAPRIAGFLLPALLGGAALLASGAEIKFDFGQFQTGRIPPGFTSLVSGPGRPGDWKVMDVAVPPALAPLMTNLPNPVSATAKHTVLAASSPDAAPAHSPLLLFTNETFANFTLTTRFKILGGSTAPEAGIAFRVQDESNYYVLRASTLGNLLWYRVVRGVRYDGQGIGVQVPIPPDDWQDLRLECVGNSIRALLNGKLLIPPVRAGDPTNDVAVNDSTFAAGMTGFWTAGDTVAYFADTKIVFTARVPLIQSVIAGVMKKNSRLLGLKVYAMKNSPLPVVVADGKNKDLGSPGGKTEADVIAKGQVYYLKQTGFVEVTQPLRDRNGEVIAALKTTMTTFRGETSETAVARATQIKIAVESGLSIMQDINE